MTTSDVRPITITTALLAILCAVLWGGLTVSIKFTQDDLPPLATAGLRFAIASLVVYSYARWRGLPLAVLPGQHTAIVSLGLLLFAQIGLFHWGLNGTNSAHGAVLIGSHPVFVAMIAHFTMAGDRLSWMKVLGLAACVTGLITLIGGDRLLGEVGTQAGRDQPHLWGDAIVLTSSFLLAAKTVYTKFALRSTEVAKLLFWSNLLGTTLFLATSLIVEGPARYHFSTSAFWGLLYQGLVVAGFCFLLWTALLEHHRASSLAVFTFLAPLCGILYAIALRGDSFTLGLALGGLAVAGGIFLVTRADVE